MEKTELVKPRAILAFEKRFKTEADYWGDVFYLRIASSWEELLRTSFCFVNDSSLKKENLNKVRNLMISKEGVTFTGFLICENVWGSSCMLAQGKLKTSAPDRLIMEVNDGVYLLATVDSDIIY